MPMFGELYQAMPVVTEACVARYTTAPVSVKITQVSVPVACGSMRLAKRSTRTGVAPTTIVASGPTPPAPLAGVAAGFHVSISVAAEATPADRTRTVAIATIEADRAARGRDIQRSKDTFMVFSSLSLVTRVFFQNRTRPTVRPRFG